MKSVIILETRDSKELSTKKKAKKRKENGMNPLKERELNTGKNV